MEKHETIPDGKTQLGKIILEQNQTALLDCVSGQILAVSSADFPVGSFVAFQVLDKQITAIELLATAESAAARIFAIAEDYKLDPYFPPEVLAEVAEILKNPGFDDSSLADYEDKPFCTIDGVNTRDLDQALFIDKSGKDFVVYYAIADAAYYVRPGSMLFNEALKRGASYYLPGLMIPMLPRELCEGVISLNAEVTRRAVVFELTLDETGQHQQTKITRAKIKSRAKLTFDAVQQFFDNPVQSPLHNTELAKSLLRLKKVGLLRIFLAEERKVVRYHRTEIDIAIGQDGLVFNLLDNMRNEIELCNEQLSLLCNTAGAKVLSNGDDLNKTTQAIYKIHAQPSEDKLAHFERILTRLIQLHHLNPGVWMWDQLNPEALSGYLKALPTKGDLARISQAVNRQALLTNNRAQFSEHADQHYGVGADVYARFSAPMREIVGVFLHKELLEKTRLQPEVQPSQEDETLRDQIILSANRAKDLQDQLTKAANKLVMDQLFMADLNLAESLRPERTGTIISLGKDKLYVLLDEPAIEIKVYIKSLEILWNTPLTIDTDQISLSRNQDQHTIASLGDGIAVKVVKHDAIKDQWVFDMNKQL